MNLLVSQLDALVCANGTHRNIEIRKQNYRNMAISLHDMPTFEVKFLKNGSKVINNTSFPTRGEYFLSYKSSQPNWRTSLWDWRS